MIKYIAGILAFMCAISASRAQQTVVVSDTIGQHIFTFDEIECLEDPNGSLDIKQVSGPAFDSLFWASPFSTPQNYNLASVYWFRIRIKNNASADTDYILEFFDQTIDEITAFMPDGKGGYNVKKLGDKYPFGQRLFDHKNFEVALKNHADTSLTYYFRIQSAQRADVIIVLRSVNWFVQYALSEYFSFGIFYGMILIFSLHNLLMFIAIRQRQYLYYVLYILSVGLYEMSVDGIAYQYLWPGSPAWNQYSFAFALYCVSVFALLFTRKLLYVKSKAPRLDKLILAIIVLRTLFFLYCLLFERSWFNYKFLEFIPLAVAFYTGIYIRWKGYRPARFFVLGYSFLFIGFILKFSIMLGYHWLNLGVIGHYSLSFCFILEMMLLSFAIGDRVRLLKNKKEIAQRQIIRQMVVNSKLKDTLNKELETRVRERTGEVMDKSRIIERQNQELKQVNDLLQEQSDQISRMNTLLKEDNRELQTNVENVTRARVMSAEVDFEEFSKVYPDKESCFQFLAELKWDQGYQCHKCGNRHYFAGHSPYSRRCGKCGYEESVIANTVFQNSKIPITKAFYIIFLVYSTKGKISSHQLSSIVGIRQGTCLAYIHRFKEIMRDRKKELRNAGGQGWSKLVLL